PRNPRSSRAAPPRRPARPTACKRPWPRNCSPPAAPWRSGRSRGRASFTPLPCPPRKARRPTRATTIMAEALRLFLAEDEAPIALLIRKPLERAAHHITTCRTAAGAVQGAAARPLNAAGTPARHDDSAVPAQANGPLPAPQGRRGIGAAAPGLAFLPYLEGGSFGSNSSASARNGANVVDPPRRWQAGFAEPNALARDG